MKTIEIKSPQFHKYFNSYYFHHKEKWGLPYRLKCYFNTNNYCESFFRKLKYKFLSNITNSRLDILTNKLFNVSHLLISEYLIRSQSEKMENKSFRI
jgi:hypothetical protein